MTLSETLARIVELGQEKVECPDCRGRGWQEYEDQKETCPPCHGSGKVTDPRYKGLVEALTKECSRGDHSFFQDCRAKGSPYRVCEYCGLTGYGSGRVLRLDWQQGALAGVLTEARRQMGQPFIWTQMQNIWSSADPNETAARYVLLEMEADHAD